MIKNKHQNTPPHIFLLFPSAPPRSRRFLAAWEYAYVIRDAYRLYIWMERMNKSIDLYMLALPMQPLLILIQAGLGRVGYMVHGPRALESSAVVFDRYRAAATAGPLDKTQRPICTAKESSILYHIWHIAQVKAGCSGPVIPVGIRHFHSRGPAPERRTVFFGKISHPNAVDDAVFDTGKSWKRKFCRRTPVVEKQQPWS